MINTFKRNACLNSDFLGFMFGNYDSRPIIPRLLIWYSI